MVRLTGQRRAVEEEDVGRTLDPVDEGDIVLADFDVRLSIGVVADQDEPAALPEGRVGQRIERDIFLYLDLGAIQRRLGGIGIADRQSVVLGTRVSVRVRIGGRRNLKKKKRAEK